MKKVLFLLISFLTANLVYAFNIDIDKIDVNARSRNLTNSLDSSYKIETNDFSKLIVNDEAAIKLVKNMINIVISNKDEETKKKEYTDHMYIDKNDGAKTLAGTIFRDTYFSELNKYKITGGYISDVKTVPFNDDVLAFAYIKDAKVNNKDNEVVLTYWLKKDNGDYKVYYPWITVGSKLEDFFEKLAKEEDSGDVVGTSYNSLSLENDGTKYVDDDVLKSLYQSNKNKVVQITGMADTGSNMYGSGFYLSEGIVVTTWSLLQQFLTDSNYIYVNDVTGNTYNVEGIIAAQVDYDVVVLKLNKEAGEAVSIADSSTLKLDDKLFMINSRNNGGFSINYGTFISIDNGRIKNLLAISSSDVGSALFNQNGEVVGFSVSDQVHSELSYANSTDYLINLQKILMSQRFEDVKYTPLEDFKDNYYLKYTDEKEYNNVPKKKWNKLTKIGNLNENINLKLIKASYADHVMSLRYVANNSSSIDSIYFVASYVENLEKEGYRLVRDELDQKTYDNGDYKIVIKDSYNYLIILIVEK